MKQNLLDAKVEFCTQYNRVQNRAHELLDPERLVEG